MPIKILLAHKKIGFLIAITYTICLLVLSFINTDKLPEIKTDNGDKILHLLAYFLLPVFWFYALQTRVLFKKIKTLLLVSIASILFGIIIE